MVLSTRRQATLALLASAAGVSRVSGGVSGQITMGTWGGGPSVAWRKALQAFTARTGIAARVAEWPDAEPAIRAQRGNPQYNVGLVQFVDTFKLLRDGLLETFSDSDLPAAAKLPRQYVKRDRDGRLVGVPVYFGCYGIAFNRSLARAADFASWHALADPKWKGKLAMTRVLWAATLDLTLYAKINGGSEENIQPGIPLLKGLASNAAVVYTGLAQMNALLTRGEVVATPYYSQRSWGAAPLSGVEFEIPAEGGLMLPYLLVVPKGAKDISAARALLAYAMEAPTQELLAVDSGYLPLNPDARLTPSVAKQVGMPLDTLRARLYQPNWDIIAAKQQERVDMVEQLIAQSR